MNKSDQCTILISQNRNKIFDILIRENNPLGRINKSFDNKLIIIKHRGFLW